MFCGWKFLVVLAIVQLAFADVLTSDAITQVLLDHNTARLDADPAPESPLGDLSYNATVESSASAHANTCVYEHSVTIYGENLFATTQNFAGNFSAAVAAADAAWEGEEAFYTLTADGDSCSNPPCGHYTQMVWNNTDSIGCGVKECNDAVNSPFGPENPFYTYVVCQYSPAGNVVGEIPYIPTDGCDLEILCSQNNFTCGTNSNICAGSQSCGTCNDGFECIDNVCEAISVACSLCGPNTECINDQCICLPGYVNAGGACVLENAPDPNVIDDFTQTLPEEEEDFVLSQTSPTLTLVQAGEHYLRWNPSADIFDADDTAFYVNLRQSAGTFGMGAFQGQRDTASGEEYPNDMMKWVISEIGNTPGSAQLQYCTSLLGLETCSTAVTIDFPEDEEVTIRFTITTNGASLRSSFQVGDGYVWFNGATPSAYFELPGFLAFYFDPETSQPSITQVVAETTTDFIVSLEGCITDETAYDEFLAAHNFFGLTLDGNLVNGCYQPVVV